MKSHSMAHYNSSHLILSQGSEMFKSLNFVCLAMIKKHSDYRTFAHDETMCVYDNYTYKIEQHC